MIQTQVQYVLQQHSSWQWILYFRDLQDRLIMLKVIHTKWCFWASACTINQKLILVHPSCANDNALLEHEIEHTKQMMLIGTWTFWAKYIFSRSFRLSVEVDAYRVQIKHGAPIIRCASNLCTFYWLGISQGQAIELLAGDKT